MSNVDSYIRQCNVSMSVFIPSDRIGRQEIRAPQGAIEYTIRYFHDREINCACTTLNEMRATGGGIRDRRTVCRGPNHTMLVLEAVSSCNPQHELVIRALVE